MARSKTIHTVSDAVSARMEFGGGVKGVARHRVDGSAWERPVGGGGGGGRGSRIMMRASASIHGLHSLGRMGKVRGPGDV